MPSSRYPLSRIGLLSQIVKYIFHFVIYILSSISSSLQLRDLTSIVPAFFKRALSTTGEPSRLRERDKDPWIAKIRIVTSFPHNTRTQGLPVMPAPGKRTLINVNGPDCVTVLEDFFNIDIEIPGNFECQIE